MSWHASGVIVRVATPEGGYAAFLRSLGLGEPTFERAATFDDALGGDGVAVASVDGWTCAWGELLVVDDGALAALACDAFAFVLEGTSDTYLFEWWAEGVRKRKRLSQAGEVVIDEGKPLPGEKAIFRAEADEEERVFALIEKLTLPVRRLMQPTYHVFRVAE